MRYTLCAHCILLEATCHRLWAPPTKLNRELTQCSLSLSVSLVIPLSCELQTENKHSHSHTIDVLQYSGQWTCWKTLGVWQTSDIPYLTSDSCRQNYFWHYCWFIKDEMPFSCSLLVASDKITSLPYSWFIMDKVLFPSSLIAAADKWLSTLYLVYYGQSTIPLLAYGGCKQSYFSPILV